MPSLSTINAMNEAQFLEIFAGVYERAPWAAQRAHAQLPFQDGNHLRATFRTVVEQASPAEQDRLIMAHPDLGGKLARAGQLTAESTREQSRLGLDRLEPQEYLAFDQLNQQYLTRFGFPFIICVGHLNHREQVLEALRTRLSHAPEIERQEALHQIHLIAELRLAALLET